ncbi:hypothetical protein BGZ61DRAFT_459052 [Ilyonectria robusta]|uniref:uncharacterized protein n=1 Tax=Ilyonectria robusta TaxID=1079257 RepID=UPI001E8DB1A6|nr:uncharacterized protein BGZ61DRAFT_459052 [Ilyonectria robusta]KAH8672213.1 hypothetical protein BGZ61DRAFT_459052 [Ilyonectria robusta]
MPVWPVRATYTGQDALEKYFTELFGPGTSTVLWKRGRFLCTIPRHLTDAEQVQLRHVVKKADHYQ